MLLEDDRVVIMEEGEGEYCSLLRNISNGMDKKI